jgi:hypothetical protein
MKLVRMQHGLPEFCKVPAILRAFGPADGGSMFLRNVCWSNKPRIPSSVSFFLGILLASRMSVSQSTNITIAKLAVIALMMEAVSTSETSVNFYQSTRRNNSEVSHLHTRCRENLKSHNHYYGLILVFVKLVWSSRFLRAHPMLVLCNEKYEYCGCDIYGTGSNHQHAV